MFAWWAKTGTPLCRQAGNFSACNKNNKIKKKKLPRFLALHVKLQVVEGNKQKLN